MKKRVDNQLKFLAEADKLKNVLRAGHLIDGSRHENSAEHSWHFALTALTLFEHCVLDDVNIERVLKMAVVHDLVEIYAGDAPAYDIQANLDKVSLEQAAAKKLFGLLPIEQASQYRTLWEEFDQMQTPDAIYAAACDRLQSLHNIHLSGGHPWKKYNVKQTQIYDRMAVIKIAIPSLWGYVEQVVAKQIESGNITPCD